MVHRPLRQNLVTFYDGNFRQAPTTLEFVDSPARAAPPPAPERYRIQSESSLPTSPPRDAPDRAIRASSDAALPPLPSAWLLRWTRGSGARNPAVHHALRAGRVHEIIAGNSR